MRQRVTNTANVLGRVARNAQSEQITFLAAGVAYYAFVSLIPLALLGLVIASVMGGSVLEGEVVELVNDFLTPDAQELLVDALTEGAGRGGATVVGFAVLLWSGLRVFRGLDKAFSQVYGTLEAKSIVNEMTNGLTVMAAILVGLAAMTIVGTAIRRFPHGPLGPAVGFVTLLGTLVVAFYPMYYVLPDTDIQPREAVPGTIVAAIGWVILGGGFQVYTTYAGNFAAYGVIGGVLLLVTWLYFGALIVIVGAVVNAVLTGDIDGGADGPAPGTDRVDGRTTKRDRQELRDSARQPITPEAMTGERQDDTAEEDGEGGDGEGVGEPGPDAAEDTGATRPGAPEGERRDQTGRAPASEVARLNRELAELRSEMAEFEDDVEDRTVDRDEVESELKRYVRRRVRRGHARGWGPYLVLLYGTAMTIGGFYYLNGPWAILAMIVIWLSTLGLYVLMVLVGAGLNLLGVPGRLRDAIGSWRS